MTIVMYILSEGRACQREYAKDTVSKTMEIYMYV